MKTAQFNISAREDGLKFSVRAKSVEHAAEIAARKICGRKVGLRAERVTGNSGLSGIFQGYVPCDRNSPPTLTSTGAQFHVY